MSELKPCQYCKQRDSKIDPIAISAGEHLTDWIFQVICLSCGAKGPEREEKVDAVAAWNKRTDKTHIRNETIDECARIIRIKQGVLTYLAEEQNNIHVSEACEATFRFSVECIEDICAMKEEE